MNFLDLLTKKLRSVAVYLNVTEIQERVEELDFKEIFPIYADMLKMRITEGTDLGELLTAGYDSLNFILGEDQLPEIFLYEVLKYLHEKDIDVLNTVFLIAWFRSRHFESN